MYKNKHIAFFTKWKKFLLEVSFMTTEFSVLILLTPISDLFYIEKK
jgi:hypothetical protein